MQDVLRLPSWRRRPISEEDKRSLSWKAESLISSSENEPLERHDMRQAGSLGETGCQALSDRFSKWWRLAHRRERRGGANDQAGGFQCVVVVGWLPRKKYGSKKM